MLLIDAYGIRADTPLVKFVSVAQMTKPRGGKLGLF